MTNSERTLARANLAQTKRKHGLLVMAKDDENPIIRSIGKDYAANKTTTVEAFDELDTYLTGIGWGL
jgi:hypothetical protein